MTSYQKDDLLEKVQKIRVDTRKGRHSPHKPLLLLLSIGRHFNGYARLVAFSDIELDLRRLIRRFGVPNSPPRPAYPFWRLRNDQLWEIDRPELVTPTKSKDAHISDLRRHDIRGGLPLSVLSALDEDPNLAWRVVQGLLNDYFPPSLHEDVLMDVGLAGKIGPGHLAGTRSKHEARDRRFREVVLRAYENRCALCEFDVRIDDQSIGLEAAHIRWHSEGGPARVANGMALCVLHHKFFDSGLFTVSSDLRVQVGGLAVGESVEQSLNQYGGLRLPVFPHRPDQRPAPKYLEWHARWVFRSGPGLSRHPAAGAEVAGR